MHMDWRVVLIQGESSRETKVENWSRNEKGVILYVLFPPAAVLDLHVAEMVELEFSGPDLTGPLRTEGRLILWERNQERNRCAFQLDARAAMTLFPLNNQRRAVRVTPDPRSSFQLKLCDLGGKVLSLAIVHDISATGVAILVSREDDHLLSSMWTFLLTIELPGQEGSFDMVADVRQRRLLGSAIAYGLEFLEAKTRDYSRKQGLVHDYVMQVQRERLQGRPG